MESPNQARMREQQKEIMRLHRMLRGVQDALDWTKTESFIEAVYDYESDHGPGSARYHVFHSRVKKALEEGE